MKNLPVNTLSPAVDRNILPPKEVQNFPEVAEGGNSEVQNADASVISLPRLKAKESLPATDAASVLDSFLGNVGDGKGLLAAHSGLDASRVFDLLGE